MGAYCLGGCDPLSSFQLDSCVPAPVCQSKHHTFQDLSRVAPNTKYLGDADAADWVSSGQPVAYQNNVLLTMATDTVGTLLASTSYMWYGNVQAKFKTSRGAGVVTAFILLSDVKDEIDYEFVGADLEHAQSNYYFQGIPDCKLCIPPRLSALSPLTCNQTLMVPISRSRIHSTTTIPTRSIGPQTR